MIDSRAIVDPTANIADDAVIGPFCVIGPEVSIGSGTILEANVVIQRHARIGKNNHIYSFASLSDPQDLSYKGEESWIEIGDNNIIRENVTISRGTSKQDNITRIGDNCLFCACSHVAHDTVVGNHVHFSNYAVVGGHCVIDDHAIIGAFSALHQFCRVGSYSFLARATQVARDVPPYLMVTGTPGEPSGLNVVGLKRAGFDLKQIRLIRKAYKVLYDNQLSLADAQDELRSMLDILPEVSNILSIIEDSQRGIIR